MAQRPIIVFACFLDFRNSWDACMAKNNDGDVKIANMNPLNNPTKGLPDKAQAENTISVCPQGRKTVVNPNKNVGNR